jgi:hypothetical protein
VVHGHGGTGGGVWRRVVVCGGGRLVRADASCGGMWRVVVCRGGMLLDAARFQCSMGHERRPAPLLPGVSVGEPGDWTKAVSRWDCGRGLSRGGGRLQRN